MSEGEPRKRKEIIFGNGDTNGNITNTLLAIGMPCEYFDDDTSPRYFPISFMVDNMQINFFPGHATMLVGAVSLDIPKGSEEEIAAIIKQDVKEVKTALDILKIINGANVKGLPDLPEKTIEGTRLLIDRYVLCHTSFGTDPEIKAFMAVVQLETSLNKRGRFHRNYGKNQLNIVDEGGVFSIGQLSGYLQGKGVAVDAYIPEPTDEGRGSEIERRLYEARVSDDPVKPQFYFR